jgi:hypothetical protein
MPATEATTVRLKKPVKGSFNHVPVADWLKIDGSAVGAVWGEQPQRKTNHKI